MAQTQVTEFSIPRLLDSEVHTGVANAVGQQADALRPTCTLLTGTKLQPAEGSEEFAQVLAANTIAIQRFEYQLPQHVHIQIDRPTEGSNNTLHGYQDRIRLRVGEGAHLEGVKLLAALRAAFQPADQKDFLEYLKEEDRSFYQSRETSIRELQKMQDDFFHKLQDFTTAQATAFQDRLAALEEKYSAKDDELERKVGDRLSEVDEREAQLKQRENDLDDRQNTHVRRELLKEMQKILQERAQRFELTKETRGRRWAPFVAFLAFLILLAGATTFFVYWDFTTVNAGEMTAWLIVRQIVFGLAFATMAGFFLKWTSEWARRHAEEEFALKRLELDVIRASWVSEHALEWASSANGEIPQQLVERLSRNLFSDDGASSDPATVGEIVASALFGSAASAKLRIGDNEVVIDRKGIKKLDKEEVTE